MERDTSVDVDIERREGIRLILRPVCADICFLAGKIIKLLLCSAPVVVVIVFLTRHVS